MIPWNPLSVLSDLAQPRTAPVPDDVQSPRNPLGFTDVRSHALPAIADAPPAQRPHLGFAPASDPPSSDSGEHAREPVFRTELSFRRNRAASCRSCARTRLSRAAIRRRVAGRRRVPPSTTTSELWPGEPHEIVAGRRAEGPFYKKELGIFRRKAKQEQTRDDEAAGRGRRRARRLSAELEVEPRSSSTSSPSPDADRAEIT